RLPRFTARRPAIRRVCSFRTSKSIQWVLYGRLRVPLGTAQARGATQRTAHSTKMVLRQPRPDRGSRCTAPRRSRTPRGQPQPTGYVAEGVSFLVHSGTCRHAPVPLPDPARVRAERV